MTGRMIRPIIKVILIHFWRIISPWLGVFVLRRESGGRRFRAEFSTEIREQKSERSRRGRTDRSRHAPPMFLCQASFAVLRCGSLLPAFSEVFDMRSTAVLSGIVSLAVIIRRRVVRCNGYPCRVNQVVC